MGFKAGEGRIAMPPSRIGLREDFDADELRRLARRSRDNRQTRRLLSLAAVYDGMSREAAAAIGGMDRQTLRDWVHRFNAEGPDGLRDRPRPGMRRRLSDAQMRELAEIVETGPTGPSTASCAGVAST
jgi:transposase